MAYYVSYANCTPEEPSSGWYCTRTNDEGEEYICGPYLTKGEALDVESDGAYSDYCDFKRDEARDRDLGSRADQIRDAGRGHLLRGDE
jgi:hypothetical protein